MNTPVPHRITDLRGTFEKLNAELTSTATPKVKKLLAEITGQLDAIDRQISSDREGKANPAFQNPGYIDMND
jgi:hypothetical protein